MGGRGHEISMGANLGVYRLSLIRTGCNHQCTYWRGVAGVLCAYLIHQAGIPCW